MWRQAVVFLLGATALVTVGHRLHREAREAGTISLSSQFLVGSLCALVAALLVVTANADGIPDEVEAPLAVVGVLVVVALTITTFRPSRRPSHRLAGRGPGRGSGVGTRGQRGPSAPRRSHMPEAPRDPTNRMHSGP